MKVKYIKANLHTKRINSEIEYIQLNKLLVCVEKTKGVSHLVYNQNDFTDELKRNGYAVSEFELPLQIDETSFNELEFSYYEFLTCDFYVFSNLVVKAGRDGLEIFCKENVNIADASKKWGLEHEIDESSLSAEYKIPKSEAGDLAVKIENLEFECWFWHYRGPGEPVVSEDRLEEISEYYESLSGGNDIDDTIKAITEELDDVIKEYNEKLETCQEKYRQFYLDEIKSAKDLINTAAEILGESRGIIEKIKSDRRNSPPFSD
jgi:hypothetical protein